MRTIYPRPQERLKEFIARYGKEQDRLTGFEEIEVDCLALSAWHAYQKSVKNFFFEEEIMEAPIWSKDQELYLYGPIGSWADEISMKAVIDEMESMGRPDPLNVRINSPGGEVFEGFVISRFLNRYKGVVNTYNDGAAWSIASVIMQAGQKRVMAENSWTMIHLPEGGLWGNADELRKEADILEKIGGGIAKSYAANSDKTPDDFYDMMREETWFDGEQAIAMGLATEIEPVAAETNYLNRACAAGRRPPKVLRENVLKKYQDRMGKLRHFMDEQGSQSGSAYTLKNSDIIGGAAVAKPK